MGDLLITQELFDENYFMCPCYNEVFKSCDAQNMNELNRCSMEICPFVYWLNKMKKD